MMLLVVAASVLINIILAHYNQSTSGPWSFFVLSIGSTFVIFIKSERKRWIYYWLVFCSLAQLFVIFTFPTWRPLGGSQSRLIMLAYVLAGWGSAYLVKQAAIWLSRE